MLPCQFPYRILDPRGRSPQPAVPITLLHPKTGEPVVHEWALVDTGADCTMLPLQHAVQLGLGPEPIEGGSYTPKTGLAPRFSCDVPLRCELVGHRFELPSTDFYVAQPFIALGRDDFLEQFECHFDQRAKTLTVALYADALKAA